MNKHRPLNRFRISRLQADLSDFLIAKKQFENVCQRRKTEYRNNLLNKCKLSLSSGDSNELWKFMKFIWRTICRSSGISPDRWYELP